MEKDPVILRTLTLEEKEAIPPQVLQKIQIEIRNLHTVYQTTVNSTKKKLTETETHLSAAKSQVMDYQKKITQLEVEKHMATVECSVLRAKTDSLGREIDFLLKIIKKNKPKINKNSAGNEFEEKKKEIDGLITAVVSTRGDQSQRVLELERTNKRLSSKVNDLKKQLTYLLDSSEGSKCAEDASQQKQNLIRIIQTLSKENDRLNEIKSKEIEIDTFNALIEEKNKAIADLERAIAKHSFNESNLAFEEQQKVLDELQRVSQEKNSLYDQFSSVYNSKISLESQVRELQEDIVNKRIEIESLRSKQNAFNQLTEKYNEVNNELIRSNVVVREYRLKIVDLTKKLEESEERYSKYILSNRTDIVAVLGREMGYIRRKISVFADEFVEVVEVYNEFINEQDKLTEMYKNRCSELEDHRIKLNRIENQQVVMNDITNVIPEEMVGVLGELYETLSSAFQDVYTLFEASDRTTSELKEAVFILQNDLQDKENTIRSLIDNNLEAYESCVKSENTMLKNEIVLLNAKLDNLQSEEYTDVINKLEQIRKENENLREYVSNLNTEILKKEHTLRNLEDNLHETTEKLGIKAVLIAKYEKIIEKLRKIKDEYVKLKKEQKESTKQQESAKQQENTNGLPQKFLNTPPKEEKPQAENQNTQEENAPFYKVKGRGVPILSTENFVISENQVERPSKAFKRRENENSFKKN